MNSARLSHILSADVLEPDARVPDKRPLATLSTNPSGVVKPCPHHSSRRPGPERLVVHLPHDAIAQWSSASISSESSGSGGMNDSPSFSSSYGGATGSDGPQLGSCTIGGSR